jgi:hypothetical protein
MSYLFSHGITTVNDTPTSHPDENQTRLVRLQNTNTYFYYVGTTSTGVWNRFDLDHKGIYTGTVIPENESSLHVILQALETAIGNITSADGNLHTIIRITDIQPTPGTGVPLTPSEIATEDLLLGDSAIIYYKKTNGENWGFYDRWVYKNVSSVPTWVFVITIDFSDYVSQIEVTRQIDKNTLLPHTNVGGSEVLGTPTFILPVTVTESGLMTPSQKEDLDELAENALKGVIDTDTIDLEVSPTSRILAALLKINTVGSNTFYLESTATGVTIKSSSLLTYESHAAATSDVTLIPGSYYCLTITNIEGVASNGKGPIFRKSV